MPTKEDRCILCWVESTELSREEAAAFILAEAVKYPGTHEYRFRDLCHKHARISVKIGELSVQPQKDE